MTWLARHCGANALVTVATDPLSEQLGRAAAFHPDTISGSPGFLQQVGRTATGLRPGLLMYGGAALASSDADRLRAHFPEARLAAFYPTTDAGALGVAADDDGVYRTFSETHFIEVLDADGQQVPVGSGGDVVVTRPDPADPRRDGMALPPGLDAAALIAALSASGEPLTEMGERDAQALAAGPLIGVLTSSEESKEAWVRAGLAWQRLALVADTYGLAVAPLTAVVENPQTRQAAAALIPAAAGQHIQMLFRLGRSPGPLPPAARRDPTWAD
jgi:hypothetical protein